VFHSFSFDSISKGDASRVWLLPRVRLDHQKISLEVGRHSFSLNTRRNRHDGGSEHPAKEDLSY
jgi:hypothetical protein